MFSIYAWALICVAGLAVGQILFKAGARSIALSGLNGTALIFVLSALVLYGTTSLLWVWLLQKADLGKLYPIMALAFVLVPALSYFLFHERYTWNYYIGVIFIVMGVIFTARG